MILFVIRFKKFGIWF